MRRANRERSAFSCNIGYDSCLIDVTPITMRRLSSQGGERGERSAFVKDGLRPPPKAVRFAHP
jgi:hypothetical protein